MNAVRFTPGPWSPFFINRGTVNTTPDGRGFYRCTVIQHNERAEIVAEARGQSVSEAQGNARLIAAAPELYEALDELTRSFRLIYEVNGDDPDHTTVFPKAAAALAKARGEQ